MAPEDILRWCESNERELWIVAIVLYGIGDTVTTLVGLSIDGVVEVGPIAAPIVERFGTAVLPAVKVLVVSLFFGLWWWLDPPVRVAVPLGVAIVGAVVTAWNAFVIVIA